jgi:hypothetical protein
MHTELFKPRLLITLMMSGLILALPLTAYAESGRTPKVEDSTVLTHEEAKTEAEHTGTERAEIKHTEPEHRELDRKKVAEHKLADAKLKVCQKREQVINSIMSRTSLRSQRQLDLFSAIAQKIEGFYVRKGNLFSNYETLTADVGAKRAVAQATVDAAKASSAEFKCDGSDPKGAASAFKASLKAQTEALKAYKTSVKNLIVGIKSAQGTGNLTDTSTGGGTE